MKSILDQLEDDQSVLLMYLADELSPLDRASVDHRLLADVAFQAQLESIRSTQNQINQSFEKLDAAHPVPGTSASGLRAFSRAVRRWQTGQLVSSYRSDGVESEPRSNWVWIGPIAAAAVLLISLGVWWGTQPDNFGANNLAFVIDDESNISSDMMIAPDSLLDGSEELNLVDAGVESLKILREVTVGRL